MKNLAESKGSVISGGMSSGTGGNAEETVAAGVWDLRDESRLDGPFKHKSDILSDAFYEAVLQGLTSSFHVQLFRNLFTVSIQSWSCDS